ncbi:MAG: hypothetical protein ABI782_03570 [Anaerolineaceae bacterium]
MLVPATRLLEIGHIPGTVTLTYGNALDLVVTLRATANPAVIWSDDVDEESLEAVAAAVRDRQGICIEVRSTAWDGETFSPLSAACLGVISGFGARALAAAVGLAQG